MENYLLMKPAYQKAAKVKKTGNYQADSRNGYLRTHNLNVVGVGAGKS